MCACNALRTDLLPLFFRLLFYTQPLSTVWLACAFRLLCSSSIITWMKRHVHLQTVDSDLAAPQAQIVALKPAAGAKEDGLISATSREHNLVTRPIDHDAPTINLLKNCCQVKCNQLFYDHTFLDRFWITRILSTGEHSGTQRFVSSADCPYHHNIESVRRQVPAAC